MTLAASLALCARDASAITSQVIVNPKDVRDYCQGERLKVARNILSSVMGSLEDVEDSPGIWRQFYHLGVLTLPRDREPVLTCCAVAG